MKTIIGRIGGTALIGTVMLTALATLPASATTAVSQPSTGTPALASVRPATSAPSAYEVVATGSISIQGSKTSATDSAISGGSFSDPTAGNLGGWVANTNGDRLESYAANISPTEFSNVFLVPKDGSACLAADYQPLNGHRNASGDLVYSGKLTFQSNSDSSTVTVTVTNLTLHPINS